MFFSGGRDKCLENLQYSRREGISLGVYTLKRRERIDNNGYKNEIREIEMCVCVCVIKMSPNGYSYKK